MDETYANFQFVQTEYVAMDEYAAEDFKQEPVTEFIPETNEPLQNTAPVSSCPIKVTAIPQAQSQPETERMQLLMQIQKDKNDLMDSFKELMNTNSFVSTTAKDRNHVDLFFESVSSSVKALTPKLVAEAKMRVSQLICELELRALTDTEGPISSVPATVVVSSAPSSQNSFVMNGTVPGT